MLTTMVLGDVTCSYNRDINMMAGKIENQEIISLTKQDNSSAHKLQFWVHFMVSFAWLREIFLCYMDKNS